MLSNQVIYENNDIKVIRDSGVRSLWIKDVCQGQAKETNFHAPVSEYMKAILEVIKEKDSVLFIGLGAGIMPSFMFTRGANVWCIEQSEEIIDVARKYFNCSQDDVNVIHGLGQKEIHNLEQFEAIVVDAQDGHKDDKILYSKTFKKVLMSHLTPKGILVYNRISSGKNEIEVIKNENIGASLS